MWNAKGRSKQGTSRESWNNREVLQIAAKETNPHSYLFLAQNCIDDSYDGLISLETVAMAVVVRKH
jgi:hypothetical protein